MAGSGKPAAPLAPMVAMAKATSPNDVLVTWKPVKDAKGYRIEVSDDNGVDDKTDLDPAPQQADMTGLDPKTTYRFRVTAFGSNGDLAVSKTITVTTPPKQNVDKP
jgi:hypothetical protein